MKTQHYIETNISTPELIFKPGGDFVSFEVSVINNSERFASFQIELIAPGAADNDFRWYTLSPEISSKKPPGDKTHFHVTIIDSPLPGFVGTINLTVRIFSIELAEQEREVIRLVLEQGTKIVPVKLELPVKKFPVKPQDLVEIPIRIENISQLPTVVNLRFLGIDVSWLVEGSQRNLQIPPKGIIETSFACQIPVPSQANCQPYQFTIEATQEQGISSTVSGVLDVLASGYVRLHCHPPANILPDKQVSKSMWWKNNSATYKINFDNDANIPVKASIEWSGENIKKYSFEAIPPEIEINLGEKNSLELVVKKNRPWLGLARNILFQVKAKVTDERVNIKNETVFLKLRVMPLFPIWLQILGVAGILYLLWAASWMNPDNSYWGHQRSVNAVQFNGVGDKLITISDDETIRRWDVNGFFNPVANQEEGILGVTTKAGRVLRYNPLGDRIVAVGLENGEIQLWGAITPTTKPISSFFYQKDDRIFSIRYSSDGRYLFTGHGSGLALVWNVDSDIANNPSRNPYVFRKHQFDFAVNSVSRVGKEDIYLAVGGRYKQLYLWNWQKDTVKVVSNQPKGGQDEYINSIQIARNNSNHMAVSDNQGYITLWNMEKCLEDNKECEILDSWQDGHGGKAVRSTSLTSDGCYLVTGGDDGRIVFWPLTPEGKRSPRFLQGIQIAKVDEPFTTVDTRTVGKYIYIASGNKDTQVRMNYIEKIPQEKCDK